MARLTPREAVGLLLFAVVGIWLYTASQRQQGALQEQLRQADSVAKVVTAAQRVAHDSAVVAIQTADSLRRMARREILVDQRAHARTDSLLRTTVAERETARQLLRDSTATTGELRAEIGRLLDAHQSDSAAHAERAAADQRTITALLRSVVADSAALGQSVKAENAAIARALAAESQVRLLKAQRPSFAGNVLRAGLYFAAGVGVAKIVR